MTSFFSGKSGTSIASIAAMRAQRRTVASFRGVSIASNAAMRAQRRTVASFRENFKLPARLWEPRRQFEILAEGGDGAALSAHRCVGGDGDAAEGGDGAALSTHHCDGDAPRLAMLLPQHEGWLII